MNLNGKVMRARIPFVCIVVSACIVNARAGDICERGQSWWDRQRGECMPCTRCDPARRQAVQYPCEIHRDTVCQSLYNVRIWPFNTPKHDKNYNTSELSSDDEYYDYVDYDSEMNESDDDGEPLWDLQTSSLVLAISGCVVFFLVVLFLSLYHAKQWRTLKQALKSDVQDLTAKLKLMEAGSDIQAEPVVATDHHIYCNIHAGKESFLGPNSNKKGLGNVYTQEKQPS